MQEAAPATAAAAAAPPPSKPFLRRGAGWEARMAAAREGRRYVPRGGAVKDYSQEGEAPLPPRRRTAGSKPPRSPVKAGSGARKAGGPTHSVPAAAAARQKPTRAGRSAPPSAVASPARPRAAERAPPAAAPAAATAGWARRLLQQQGAPQPVAGRSAPAAEAPQSLARQVEEVSQGLAGCLCCCVAGKAQRGSTDVASTRLRWIDAPSPAGTHQLHMGCQPLAPPPCNHPPCNHPACTHLLQAAALQEFEALESQVLREVHTNSPAPHSSGSKKAPGSKGDAPRPPSVAGASAQQWAPQAAAEAGMEPENWVAAQHQDEDVFASDGEGGVCSLFGEDSHAQAAAAGVAHPLACRVITFGGSSMLPTQPAGVPAVAQRRGPPPVYCDEGDEGEMHAEVRCDWVVRLARSGWVSGLPDCLCSAVKHNNTLTLHCNALQSSFQDLPRPAASSLVQRFFSRPAPTAVPQEAARPAQQRSAAGSAALPGDPQHASAAEAEALEQLQQEVVALQQERARVARMRLELEDAAGRLEQDKAAFEKRQVGCGRCRLDPMEVGVAC